MEQKSNKQLLTEMYRYIIRDHRIDLLDEYVHDDYIQHSPMLPD
jgi:predicted SnoaL-like aldol condensation-catalyzing enzyme